MKSTTTSHKGNHDVSFPARTRITIRTSDAFTLETTESNGSGTNIIGPNSNNDRYSQTEHNEGDTLHITTDGRSTIVAVELAPRDEQPNPNSLCEVVHEEKLSMYDRLKAEMFQAISKYAEDKGIDTWEDDQDHDFEDEDEPLIDTPYEYIAMQDDILNDPNDEVQAPAPSEPIETPVSEPVEPPTPLEPIPAS